MRPGRVFGHIPTPNADEIKGYARRHRIVLNDQEAEELVPAMAQTLGFFDAIDELPMSPPPPLKHPNRDPGRAPTAEEDPLNALIRICRVEGSSSGPLAGLTAVVKDGIAVAGVPMTNGSRMLPVLTPSEDAVAVERILDAGATIVGKANMENMGWGTGVGSAFGPALNPANPEYSTGGSSSGSAAAVAAGEVDFALGADEAGSIRIPSAMCGIVGMKPTHGLVPTFGMTYFDHTLDHIGPLTRDVELNARVLQAIAGADPRDPQWKRFAPAVSDYAALLDEGVDGMEFRVVEEAVAWSGPDVREAFEAGCDRLRDAGATVASVSIPLWKDAWAIENAMLTFSTRAMLESGGAGYGHIGRIDAGAAAAFASQLRNTPRDLPILFQLSLLSSEHLLDTYMSTHFARAQDLRAQLTQQIEDALDGGVLITPTTPNVAKKLPQGPLSFAETVPYVAGDTVLNTCPMDLSGHPALSVPVGTGEAGMPAGMQFVGRYLDEATLYRAGNALMRMPAAG